MNKKKEISKLLVYLAAYYGRKLEDITVSMMADDLIDLEFAQVTAAAEKWRKNPANKFFPIPAQLREIVEGPAQTPKQNAIETTAKLIAAVKRYDYTWQLRLVGGYIGGSFQAEFRHKLGDLAWIVVSRFGGWQMFCESFWSTDEGIFRAQLREAVEAIGVKFEADLISADNYPALEKKIDSRDSIPLVKIQALAIMGEEKGMPEVAELAKAEIERRRKNV